MENYRYAVDIMRAHEDEKQIALLNAILDEALATASETGRLDLSHFLIGCFAAKPLDEPATARIIRGTKLFNVIPALSQDQENFRKLFAKKRLNLLVKLPESAMSDSEIEEIEVFFTLDELVKAGNYFHEKAKVDADPLTQNPVYESALRVLIHLYLPQKA
jgi:hypothetical protein